MRPSSWSWQALVCVMLLGCGGDDGDGGVTPCVPGTCPADEVCEEGVCVPIRPCTGPADCDTDELCSVTGACIASGTCLAEADCSDGERCSVTGACILDGTCAADGDCMAGMVCDATRTCVPGSSCGAQELTITPVPPNLLLVLDRSCSMRNAVGGVPKWTSAVNAIRQLTTNFEGDIRWGLTMFPDTVGGECGQGAIPVPVAADAEPRIRNLLTAALATNDVNYPDGPCVTNIDSAMAQAATEPALDDATRKSFAMLITDGMQAGCSAAGGDNGTERIIADLATLRDVKTFVVGFGGGVDGAQLDEFAVAGGTALPQSPRYYQADNAVQLEAALATIGNLVIGCDFVLTTPPADLALLFAFFNNTIAVPRDPTHANGWDFDPVTMTLTFYGGFCEDLRDGTVTDVDIVYGCDGPTPD